MINAWVIHVLTYWHPWHGISQRVFHVESLEKTAQDDFQKLASAVYLQVSTISQALIFVTRSRSWSFMERPGFLLVFAFLVAQLVSRPINTIHAERPKSILLQLITTTCSHSWVTDCYDNCRVRWLGICRDQRHWMGLGWCHLALQHRLLLATGCHQVPHSLCDERESLGSCPRSKGKNTHIVRATFLSGGVYSCFPAWPPNTDRIHEEEGFRTGRTWAQVGDRSEDATWASASRVGHFPWHEQLQRTQPARRRGPQESWNCKVQLGENISPSSGIYICCNLWFFLLLQAAGAQHPEGADGVGGEAEGVGPWDHPAVVHRVTGYIDAFDDMLGNNNDSGGFRTCFWCRCRSLPSLCPYDSMSIRSPQADWLCLCSSSTIYE